MNIDLDPEDVLEVITIELTDLVKYRALFLELLKAGIIDKALQYEKEDQNIYAVKDLEKATELASTLVCGFPVDSLLHDIKQLISYKKAISKLQDPYFNKNVKYWEGHNELLAKTLPHEY